MASKHQVLMDSDSENHVVVVVSGMLTTISGDPRSWLVMRVSSGLDRSFGVCEGKCIADHAANNGGTAAGRYT
jgi:hypothetical protein